MLNRQACPDFARIISDSHCQRICGLIDQLKVLLGGRGDVTSLFIALTVMRDVLLTDEVMSEEFFGPALAVLEYEKMHDVLRRIGESGIGAYHGFHGPERFPIKKVS